ncbi:hypothetical protein ACN42_g5227 [Penicillium freii]|uniref:ABC transporter n=1 Tax=Penicillium freii TaxID=48697 RepID=A0A101MJT1_PENFR|nr:hypothetical protein ACN42_g5227 [Penicillium freii]
MRADIGHYARDAVNSVPSFHGQSAIGDLELLFGNVILTIVLSSFGIVGFSIWSIRKSWQRPDQKVVLHGRGVFAKSILCTLLVLLYLAYLITVATLGSLHGAARRFAICAATLQFCCSVSLSLAVVGSHVWEIRASSFAQLFATAWALTDIARIILLAESDETKACLGILSSILGVKVLLLVVEEITKRNVLNTPYNKYPPEALSGIINRVFVVWLNPLMWRGIAGKPLSLPELSQCESEFTSTGLSRTVDVVWEKKVTGRSKHNLFLLLAWEFRWLFLIPTPTRFAQAAFQFVQPFLIQRTLNWYDARDDTDPQSVAWGLLVAYGLVYLGIALTTAYSQYQIVRFIAAIRGTLVLLIFRKSLELQKSDMAPLTLMSTDVERIIQGLHYVHESFVSFFTFSVALWLLKRQLGVGAIAPIVVSVCSMLVIATFGKSISNAQKRWVEAVEKRVSVTTEILTSMKGIKMSGLSKYSSALLQGLRETELIVSLTMRRFLTVGIGLSFTTPTLSPMVGFAVYTALASHHGNTLLAATAFPALSIFNLLSSPLSILIQSLPGVIAMFACFERIGTFLQRDARNDTRYLMNSATTSAEKMPSDELRPASSRGSSSITLGRDLIRIVDGKFWRTTDSEPILQDLNLQIKRETLTAVVGPSGCGKTTLFEALLGELPCPLDSIKVDSAFDLRTGIAYCPQQPWLRNDTVRNNIIAGMPYNEAWYNTVIHACALEEIIQKLSEGMVGSGGTSLSGGQKQRISLARAIYSRRPLLLLDDSLSGIDNLSIQHIFDRLLGANGLIKQTGTTAILATQNVKNPGLFDQIITFGGDGTVLERKSPADAENNSEKPIGPGKIPIEAPISISQNPFAFALEARFETAASDPRDRRKGELGAYKYYFASLGFRKLGLAVFLVVSYVFFSSFPQIWLQWWTASNVDHPNNRLGYWIGVYAVFGFLAVFSLIAASWLMLCNMVKDSAESLHLELVQTVERAVASVFTSTDPGITVNRFSQDMALVDMELPMAFANTIISFTTCVAQLVIIAVSSRYLGATIPFILGVCILTQRLYIRTSRQLRFFDIEAKSPLYTEFIELLNGLHVVRAFDMQKEFEERLATALDASQKPFYLLLCAQRWLGLVLNLVNLGLALILVGVTTATRGISGGFLGVALINLTSFGPSLSDLVDVWCTLENSLAAVERVKYFSEETPKESTDSPVSPSPGWPELGAIQIKELCLGYDSDSLAVKSLSLAVPAGKKIAICGRSGSGKSTLCMALFRMLEPISGTISIDGQDISRVPHEVLRSSLSIVPQDAVILGGSIRLNVDPENQHSNTEVIEALEQAELWESVKERFGREDDTSAESLSGGQKKQLCLARALVKKSKILVLDEATASADPATDQKVHELVNRGLPGTTVVSVIHRLKHVGLYDLVAVFDDGELVEMSNPVELLEDSASRLVELFVRD